MKYSCPQNKKIPSKITNFGRFGQNIIIFGGYSWFFQKPYLVKSWVFCVAFSASGRFFWAIKNSFLTIIPIFHRKGGPLWFRTSKKLTTPLKMAENWKQKYFCKQNYKWIKNPDGTVCLKGWIKKRISLVTHTLSKGSCRVIGPGDRTCFILVPVWRPPPSFCLLLPHKLHITLFPLISWAEIKVNYPLKCDAFRCTGKQLGQATFISCKIQMNKIKKTKFFFYIYLESSIIENKYYMVRNHQDGYPYIN